MNMETEITLFLMKFRQKCLSDWSDYPSSSFYDYIDGKIKELEENICEEIEKMKLEVFEERKEKFKKGFKKECRLIFERDGYIEDTLYIDKYNDFLMKYYPFKVTNELQEKESNDFISYMNKLLGR